MKILGSLLSVLVAFQVACSNRYRDVSEAPSGAEVKSTLSSIETGISTMSGTDGASDVNEFFAIVNQAKSTFYFAEGPSTIFGPLVSVISVVDLSFLDSDLAGYGPADLENGKVFFAMLPSVAGGADCALLVLATVSGQTQATVKAFTCDSVEVKDGEFLAILSRDGQPAITLRSFDIDYSEKFPGAIQLRLGVFDAAGVEQPWGQFSTLVGYSP